MFRSPLCSPWLTPLADFLFVSLHFSLPPSLSVSLPPTIHRITWARGMKRCIVFFWMRAACVCVRVAAILYRYADIAALACYSGQRRKGCVLSTIVFTALFIMSQVQCCLQRTQRLHFNSHTCTQVILLTESCGEWKLAQWNCNVHSGYCIGFASESKLANCVH